MSEEKKELFPEDEVVRSESFQVLRGDNVRDVLSCIDSYLASLARKLKTPPNIPETLIPFSASLIPSTPVVILLTPIDGEIANVTILVEETTSKGFELQLTAQEGNVAKTMRFTIRKGLLTSEDKIEVKKNTVISVNYFLNEGESSSPPIISFTFRGKR